MIFLVLMLLVLGFISSNVLIWWSMFLMMTIIFCFLSKSDLSYSSLINYFIIQETLGLFFLILNFSLLQVLIVMMKVGIAPLHFWVFSVTNGLSSFMVMWFLTFQKMPFFPVLVQIFDYTLIVLLMLGIFLCFIQLFLLKGYKNMMIISSTESLNWILLMLFFSMLDVIFLFMYYFFFMVFLMPYFSKKEGQFFNWELILVFMNIPMTVNFFIKIFSLFELFKLDSVMVLFMLFLMFMTLISLSIWLINLSTVISKKELNNNSVFYFMVLSLMVLMVI
uniref:NADH dehydrogenase subunit 2 n=1 Tax=Gnathostoma nipponicum TaxID=279403 RepID=A0A1S6YGS3_9BILA|nr:NADH dehydrogenase subunit 2 [Gnathostoma nipponicum]AQX44507.1 NADH dehydrogenase subunit 2 [Gnathostoma nipponicum]